MSRLKDRRFGKKLADAEDDKNEVKETYSPGEPDPILQILRSDLVELTGELVIRKNTLQTDIMILDHPTQSKLDGTYDFSAGKYSSTTILETQNF